MRRRDDAFADELWLIAMAGRRAGAAVLVARLARKIPTAEAATKGEGAGGHKKAQKIQGDDANVRSAYRRSGDFRRRFQPFSCLFVAKGLAVLVWLPLDCPRLRVSVKFVAARNDVDRQ